MKEIIIGIFFIAVGLLFGSISLTYTIGTLSNMGPGYYPLILSVALIVLGIVNILREVIYGHN
jgi:hypothetical protein